MFQWGLLPNQDLGKENKGRIDSIIPNQRFPKTGLGYFLGEATEKSVLHANTIVRKSDKPNG